MNSLILSHNFYSDIDSFSTLISSMEFEDTVFGKEIKDFNYIPQGTENQFELDLNEKLEIQSDTGIFRKPNKLIHFEPFFQHCQWVCIVALEDTIFKIHEHENIKSVLDVENMDEFLLNNANKLDDWKTLCEINMKKNDYIYVRPIFWHSLQENNLVQIFLLNKIVEEKE